jgi:hypothetical protein
MNVNASKKFNSKIVVTAALAAALCVPVALGGCAARGLQAYTTYEKTVKSASGSEKAAPAKPVNSKETTSAVAMPLSSPRAMLKAFSSYFPKGAAKKLTMFESDTHDGSASWQTKNNDDSSPWLVANFENGIPTRLDYFRGQTKPAVVNMTRDEAQSMIARFMKQFISRSTGPMLTANKDACPSGYKKGVVEGWKVTEKGQTYDFEINLRYGYLSYFMNVTAATN